MYINKFGALLLYTKIDDAFTLGGAFWIFAISLYIAPMQYVNSLDWPIYTAPPKALSDWTWLNSSIFREHNTWAKSILGTQTVDWALYYVAKFLITTLVSDISCWHNYIWELSAFFFTPIQKWHERYFLLRANKTIEIHKSRKAAEAQKTPRRVIDLRECISLELGLEYKNLQHILSLGTFERTFFLAAPSNALMLQWGNVLEKVKSAESGMYVHSS